VLARPFARALAVVAVGLVLLAFPLPVPVGGALLVATGAIIAFAAVWRWDKTRLVVTTEKILLVDGVVRRRASAVVLRAIEKIELEQSLPGRALGYGTLVAGPLKVAYVPDPRRVSRLIERVTATASLRP
jgi:uncharacterized membrane protein YdbT with pleckstrin-like domain